MANKVTVHVVSGTPRQVWCDRCLTSAGYEVDCYAFLGDGPPTQLGTARGCERCGPLIPDEPNETRPEE